MRRMLDCFGAVATFFHRHKTEGRTPYPVLTDIAEELSYIPPSLGMLIDHAIDTTSGLVKDMPHRHWLKSVHGCAECLAVSIRYSVEC